MVKKVRDVSGLDVNNQLKILRLYDDAIISRLVANHSKLNSLARFIKPDDFETLLRDYDDDYILFAEKFWEYLCDSPARDALYPAIVKFIYECDGSSILHNRLTCSGSKTGRYDFVLSLQHLDEIMDVLDPIIACEKIASISAHHEMLMRPVKNLVRRRGLRHAIKYILRCVPYMGEGAYMDLLNAAHASGTAGEELVFKINPNFQRFYQLYTMERKKVVRGKFRICHPEDSVADLISSPASDIEHIDFRFQNLPPTILLDNLTISHAAGFEGGTFELRQYQKELANPAYKGINLMVCAPTGTGKTVVAASIALHHLSDRKKCKEPRKICFFVTNTTFLEQQALLLDNFFSYRWKISTLSAATVNVPIVPVIESSDIIVITPQLIANLLQSQNEFDLPFSLATFSLMFFDEAHHCDSYHPYNVIMSAYHEMKSTGNIPNGRNMPQIIGLTASLGAGNAKDTEEAVKHIIHICANLDVRELSFVKENIEELSLYTGLAADDIVFVNSNHGNKPYYQSLLQMLQSFENILKNISSKYSTYTTNFDVDQKHLFWSTLTSPPFERDSQAYEQWYSLLSVRLIPEAILSPDERIRIVECFQYIKVIHRSLELARLFPGKVCCKYFVSQVSVLNETASKECLAIVSGSHFFHESQEHGLPTNALFEMLLRQLREEFKKKADSRALIFVRMREFAAQLCSELNADDELIGRGIKSGVITGISVSKLVGGQNVNDQVDSLAKFAKGDIKIICATSVAQEGIDIQKCNLVIKYNYVTNEIALVQMRGRGRARDSRCMLLTMEKKLKAQEERNINREKTMKEALKVISSHSADWFSKEVDKQILKLNEDRIASKALEKERVRSLKDNRYYLLCRKCDALICESNDIVTASGGSQYLCVCEKIWCRAKQFPYSSAKILAEQKFKIQGIAYLCCKKPNCGLKWGRAACYEGVTLPVIASDAFVLVSVSTPDKRFQTRKWKQILQKFFIPREITLYDLAKMKEVGPTVVADFL